MLHIALHLLVPALVVGIFFRKSWKPSYLVLVATMLVDMDHLLANPIYDPSRCSIGFHPLHQPWFLVLYLALSLVRKSRRVGIGLSIHMFLDALDC